MRFCAAVKRTAQLQSKSLREMEEPPGCIRAVMVLTSASKLNIEPNGGIFDVSSENDRASRNVKTPSLVQHSVVLKTQRRPCSSV